MNPHLTPFSPCQAHLILPQVLRVLAILILFAIGRASLMPRYRSRLSLPQLAIFYIGCLWLLARSLKRKFTFK